MDHIPRSGDVLLRGDSESGFAVLDAVTHDLIQGGMSTLLEAVDVARARGAGSIWQQSVDNRGRPLGDPARWRLPADT
ncbi:MAG TPA: hypothetical protein VMO26_25820 [Vicinamibacterales bacterium]|nr:hypothetical protein [Vicinamibacterales bacterium]